MAPFERSNLVAYEQGGSDSTRIAVRFNGLTRQAGESETSLGFRRTSGRRAGCFAEQVTRHDYDGEAPTALGKRFKICLDEEFDGLPPAIELDANRRISEIHLVSATILPRMIAWGKTLILVSARRLRGGTSSARGANRHAWRRFCNSKRRGLCRIASDGEVMCWRSRSVWTGPHCSTWCGQAQLRGSTVGRLNRPAGCFKAGSRRRCGILPSGRCPRLSRGAASSGPARPLFRRVRIFVSGHSRKPFRRG